MAVIRENNILETIRMIDEECLDIRTVTMGISLLDCADTDIDASCRKIKEKIRNKAYRKYRNRYRVLRRRSQS